MWPRRNPARDDKDVGWSSGAAHLPLDLARLYCATGREREARDLLASALVGFDETPELPEIGEAQRLLASLGGDDMIR